MNPFRRRQGNDPSLQDVIAKLHHDREAAEPGTLNVTSINVQPSGTVYLIMAEEDVTDWCYAYLLGHPDLAARVLDETYTDISEVASR